MPILPPVAPKKRKELTIHGHTRVDDYFWMNDRESKDVLDYIRAENDYAEEVMAPFKKLEEKLYTEMRGRIKEDDTSVPYRLGEYWYYQRYEEGHNYPVFCRKKTSLENSEEVILNVNELAEGKSYCQVNSLSISQNDQLLAYSLDTVGRRIYTIFFKNLETGDQFKYSIENTTGDMVWANDNQTLFYTKQDDATLRPFQVYKHKINKEASTDELVFQEDDETFFVTVSKTKSKEYLKIYSHSTVSSEVRFLDAGNPDGEWKLFQARERDFEYSVDHYESHFYVITNWKAKNFRLMKTPLSQTQRGNWEEVIAHRNEVLLEGLEIFHDYLVVEEREEGLLKIRVIEWKNGREHYLEFGEPVYTAFVGTNPDFDATNLRFHYQSLATPSTVYEYDMVGHTKKILKRQEVVGGYDPEGFETKRIFARSVDGVEVPISVVYKKGLKLNGANPCLIKGYGSYGVTYDVSFQTSRLSLLERGFVFAITHIRGSEYLGRSWYEQGKLLNKKNTFSDFISCAERLISLGFTSSEKLVIAGGSAGGLLMGAVINERPELFKAVIAQVPFVDVVTTMLDDSIPLTTGEYDEWGNPNDKKYYDYMLSYSPYDQVKKQEYPNLLVTSGLHDSQVQYWEPTKWVAKLRAYKTDKNILLLKTNMEAGHSGPTGRFKALEELAFEYAFILSRLGITE